MRARLIALGRCGLLLALAGAAGPQVFAAASNECPRATPDGLQSEPVGEDLVVNGLPLRVRQVRGKADLEAQLEQTAKQWQDEGFAVRRDRVGSWQLISAGGVECNTTLQLRMHPAPNHAGERIVGYLGVSQPHKMAARMPKLSSFALPGGVELASAVSGSDAGRYSHTLTLHSKRGVEDLNEYFLRHLTERRWDGVASHEVRGAQGDRARIVSAQKGHERFTLVMWRDDLTRLQLTVAEVP